MNFLVRLGGEFGDNEDCEEGKNNSRNHFVEREDWGDKIVPDKSGDKDQRHITTCAIDAIGLGRSVVNIGV